MTMLDYYTLQATLEKLTTAQHTYTPTDIATLCRAGKLTPIFAYNRYYTPVIDTPDLSKTYEIILTSEFSGYLTNRKLLDILDGYSNSVKLSSATVIQNNDNEANGYDVILLDQPFNYYRYQSDDSYNPVAESEPLTVTLDQLLFKREEVEALVSNTQSSQPKRETEELNNDKKLIAMMALLLAKHSNVFLIGDRPNATAINEAIRTLVKQLNLDDEDKRGLLANTDKISKAVQAHADELKILKN